MNNCACVCVWHMRLDLNGLVIYVVEETDVRITLGDENGQQNDENGQGNGRGDTTDVA